jgi:Na+-translocating ferredoxin:NAD+ oxidoreductase RnfC subunit
MMTKHKIVKLDKVLALEFRDALARNDGERDSATKQQEDLILNENEVDEDSQVDEMMMIHQDASTYEGIRSAVAFLLGEQHMTK